MPGEAGGQLVPPLSEAKTGHLLPLSRGGCRRSGCRLDLGVWRTPLPLRIAQTTRGRLGGDSRGGSRHLDLPGGHRVEFGVKSVGGGDNDGRQRGLGQRPIVRVDGELHLPGLDCCRRQSRNIARHVGNGRTSGYRGPRLENSKIGYSLLSPNPETWSHGRRRNVGVGRTVD